MNISYNWLRELTGVTLAPKELAERLTMIGLAVEVVHEVKDDSVLEIDLTSNRPDCLSHLGVAREVAAATHGRVSLPVDAPSRVKGRAEDYTAVEILDADLCPRYAGRVVRGVTIKPSPDWLVKRLEAIGQRPINNVADITNYVLHEQGQPLHAFDLSKLAEARIVVRRARKGEKIRTLDGVERALEEEMLVIADAVRAVAVAGVMGGEETEISDATRDVLIESAYFNPASVRRTAKKLGLHTEASHRFERGVDYAGVLRAQERCVALICELAGGTATENAIDVYPKHLEPPMVSLRPERVKSLTGLDVDSAEMLRILLALGFIQREAMAAMSAAGTSSLGASRALNFIAPTWRVDIEREEDLVEEVARHFGYEKIATALPASNIAGEYQPSERKRRALRRAMTASGFDEAISFSFIAAEHDGRFELLPNFASGNESDVGGNTKKNESGYAGDESNRSEGNDEGKGRFVSLTNPIIEGVTRMRPTLLSGMLDAVRHNFNHGTRDVRLFETGRIFAANSEQGKLPLEREAFALVATGGVIEEGRAGAARELDFYDLKGALEVAVDTMNLRPLRFEAASVKHLREGQAARILIDPGVMQSAEMSVPPAVAGGSSSHHPPVTAGGTDMLVQRRVIGSIGRLDEAVASLYKFRQPVYVAEVDLSALLDAEERLVLYTPLARHPSVVRDVSLLVGRRVSLAEMLDAITDERLENFRDAKLVDVYEGANLPEGKRSMTLRIEYRADDRTLRDEEVDALHARLVELLETKFGAQQRV
ncbi:MAG: phenylalanyl-tRNA synthetase beta chain [Acidobacteriota bacterium]|jgi:phenylalanyl-tRNA synthetase beta chain|nr:phenylalanyl-tRNA synthetase beta chain [Acidobacteriota bacterium]